MEIDGTAGAPTYRGAMTLDTNVLFVGVGTYSWNLFDMASETGTFTTISLTDQYSGSLTNNPKEENETADERINIDVKRLMGN